MDTPGGRYHAEWDEASPVPREGSWWFFVQFLKAGGRWENFLKDWPLTDPGNRGRGANNVMGTALLNVLSGHWRYAHANGVPGDLLHPPPKPSLRRWLGGKWLPGLPEGAGLLLSG